MDGVQHHFADVLESCLAGTEAASAWVQSQAAPQMYCMGTQTDPSFPEAAPFAMWGTNASTQTTGPQHRSSAAQTASTGIDVVRACVAAAHPHCLGC